MEDMITTATAILQAKYKQPLHTVASLLVTKNGKEYTGMNVDHFSGFVCAEAYVLAHAINSGETEFRSLVAMRKEPDGTVSVANPCGKCRQLLFDYAPGVQVVVVSDAERQLVAIEDLLPYGFTRQREKIQAAMNNEGAGEVIG